jgi:sporulation protein YunB
MMNRHQGGMGMRFRRGWHSRKRRSRVSRRKLWLIISAVFILFIFQFIGYVERNMKEPIKHLANIRVKQIATKSISDAIMAQVANQADIADLIDWKEDSSGKINGFMLNYSAHMRITSDTIKTVRKTLEDVSKLSEHIPLGQALGSPLIASFGPNIPIKIEPQGDVKVDLNTRRQDAGINMILVEVYLRVKTELAVVVPFDMGAEAVETEIPISYLLVVGDVPMYYYDNKGNPVGNNGSNAPTISLPAAQPEKSGESGTSSGTKEIPQTKTNNHS